MGTGKSDHVRWKSKITPEKAKEMLKKEGMDISLKQAKNILDLLSILAILEVNEYLKK